VTPEELAEQHPLLYHLTERDAVATIRAHGLWSAAALVRGCGLDTAGENRLLRRRRERTARLDHPTFGRIAISDNDPIHIGPLERCLDDGLTPPDWLEILNGYVFFWTDEKDAHGLRNARNNRMRNKSLLIFDTFSLVSAYFDNVALCPINSGAAKRNAPRRGYSTFASAGEADFRHWRRSRGLATPDKIKEIVVQGGIPDIERYLCRVSELDPP